jgi:hypothetical protein
MRTSKENWHMARLRKLACVVACAAAASGKGQAAQPFPPGVVALVNGVAISQAQVQTTLKAAGMADTTLTQQTIKQGLIARELIRQAAEAEQLGNDPTVSSLSGDGRVFAENRLYIQRHAKPLPVTEDQVRARYEAAKAELGPREYLVQWATSVDRAALQRVLTRVSKGESFDAVAQLEKVPLSGLVWVSFKLPPTSGHTAVLPLALAQALIPLKVGEITPNVVALDGAYTLVKLNAQRETLTPPFNEVRESLRQLLETEANHRAFDEVVSRLASRARVVQ